MPESNEATPTGLRERPPDREPLPGTSPVAEVEAIHWSADVVFEAAEIERYVEQPLVPACRVLLFEKNIRTTYTSANAEDALQGRGVISID